MLHIRVGRGHLNFMNTASFSLPAVCKWLAALVVAEWFHIPGAMRALVFFMLADYVTGVGAAIVRHELSSDVAWRGLIRKTMVLALLLLIRLAENAAGLSLNIEQAGAIGYLITEVISIVENLARAGVPVPASAVAALLAAKQLNKAATAEQIDQLSGKQ